MQIAQKQKSVQIVLANLMPSYLMDHHHAIKFKVHLSLLHKVLFTTTDVKLESSLEAQDAKQALQIPQNSLLSAVTRIIQIAAH